MGPDEYNDLRALSIWYRHLCGTGRVSYPIRNRRGSMSDRNMAIGRRVSGGETRAAVARAFGLSPSRVGQIYNRWDRFIRARRREERHGTIEEQASYAAGWAYVVKGRWTRGWDHFSPFETPEREAAWERGKRDARSEIEAGRNPGTRPPDF